MKQRLHFFIHYFIHFYFITIFEIFFYIYFIYPYEKIVLENAINSLTNNYDDFLHIPTNTTTKQLVKQCDTLIQQNIYETTTHNNVLINICFTYIYINSSIFILLFFYDYYDTMKNFSKQEQEQIVKNDIHICVTTQEHEQEQIVSYTNNNPYKKANDIITLTVYYYSTSPFIKELKGVTFFMFFLCIFEYLFFNYIVCKMKFLDIMTVLCKMFNNLLA